MQGRTLVRKPGARSGSQSAYLPVMASQVDRSCPVILHAARKEVEHGIEFHVQRVDLAVHSIKPIMDLSDLYLEVRKLLLNTIYLDAQLIQGLLPCVPFQLFPETLLRNEGSRKLLNVLVRYHSSQYSTGAF